MTTTHSTTEPNTNHPAADTAAAVRVFTGLKPTGRLQVGNYLGAIRPILALTEDPTHEVTVSIANLHALTMSHNPEMLREQTIEMATTLLACGLPDHARLFVQSSVPTYTELHYLLESTATYGEMHRMVQFKEKSEGQESHRLSLLSYPSLMAADILGSRAHVVPVGEDQKQHIELTRTVARRFNRTYGPVFDIPRGITPPQGARVKDFADPTSKMGKSGADRHGVIHLLDSPDEIAAKVRRATTDTDRTLTFDPVLRPGVANLAVVLGALTERTPEAALVGVDGSAALKAAVTDALIATFEPIGCRYRELKGDTSYVLSRLRQDAAAVGAVVDSTVKQARDAIGLITP